MIRSKERDPLAQFLGWFSIGLGAAQVTAPGAMCRIIGASGRGRAPTVMRLLGIRELVQGTGILARPRPTGWVWSRVVGDGADLALLGAVVVGSDRKARTAFAALNVAAVAAADVYEAMHLSSRGGRVEHGQRIRKAVTIAKTREQVEEAWSAATALRAKVDRHGADVSFLEAPGDRGTELAVEFTHDPPAGDIGAMVEKLSGRDLATQLSDDLRRFKAQLETGEVLRSEGTPAGHSLGGHVRQRPAQPLEQVAA